MKKFILTAVAAAMLCGLCSCGQDAASESTEQTSAATTTEAEVTTEAVPTNEELIAAAKKLFAVYSDYIDMQCGKLLTDEDSVITVDTEFGELEFERVLRYDSVEDLRAHFREYFTENVFEDIDLLDEEDRYESLLFHEQDGKLYYHSSRDESWYGDGFFDGYTILSADESHFTFRRLGEFSSQCADVSCVKEDGKWKIDHVEEADIDEEDYEAHTRSDFEEFFDDIPDDADLTAMHIDYDNANVVFDKPVDELSDVTLMTAAKPLHYIACGVGYAIDAGWYPWVAYMDYDTRLPESEYNVSDYPKSIYEDDPPGFYLITNVNTKEEAIAEYYKTFSDKYPYPEKLDRLMKEYDGRLYGKNGGIERSEAEGYEGSEMISFDGRDGDEFRFTVRDHYDGHDEDREFTAVMGDDGVWRIGKYTLPY